MADPLLDFIDENRTRQQKPVEPLQQTAPIVSGAGTDELLNYVDKARSPAIQEALPQTQAAESNDPLLSFVDKQQAPKAASITPAKTEVEQPTVQADKQAPNKQMGYGELLSGGFQRGWQSTKAVIPAWKGIIAELQGDSIAAATHMREAAALEESAPKAQWELKNVSNPDEFMRWLTEKFGENAINLVGAIPVAGAGAFVGQLAARGLVKHGLTAQLNMAGKSLPAGQLGEYMIARGMAREISVLGSKTTVGGLGGTIGAGAGLYPYTVGIETPQTAGEQFQVTDKQNPGFGTTNPGRSIAAGMAKGLLEMWTPLSISRALLAPGMQLGKSYSGAIAKTFLKEAGTEAAQEAIDIYARQIADPSYSYFTNGFTLNPRGFGEGAWRLAEAGVAGGFIGAPFGAAGHYGEKKLEVRRAIGGAEPFGERVLPSEAERPVKAAVLLGGKWYTAATHGTAVENAAQELGITVEEASNRVTQNSSFLTNNGRIVDKDEAAALTNKPFISSGMLPQEVIADDKVTVKDEGGHLWSAISDYGMITARVDNKSRNVTITSSGLDAGEKRGQGHGLALYKALADEALQKGYALHSDSIVSEEAGRMYDALERRGYKIERLDKAQRQDEEGVYYSSPGTQTPVFRITEGPITALRRMVVEPAKKSMLSQEAIALHPAIDGISRENTYNHSVGQLLTAREQAQNREGESLAGNENIIAYPDDRAPIGSPDRVAFEQANAERRRIRGERETRLRATDAAVRRGGFKVVPREPRDILPQEAIAHDPREDLLDLGPLISDSFHQPQIERFLDLLEAHTPRYVEAPLPGAKETRVWTDTELELEFATNRPAAEKPQLMRIDQGSLQPAAITATVLDIAEPTSARIWFLEDVSPEDRVNLRIVYNELYKNVQNARRLALADTANRKGAIALVENIYGQLLTQGLRVVPSRGAGFHYNAVLNGEPVEKIGTKRSVQVALYDFDTGNITPFSDNEAALRQSAEFQDMTDGSLIVAVDLNRVKEEDLIFNADGSFKLRSPLDLDKLVPGIHILDLGSVEDVEVGFSVPEGESKITQLGVKNKADAQRVRAIIEPLLPLLQQQLKDAQVPHGVGIVISDVRAGQYGEDHGSPGQADVSNGVIHISPEILADWEFTTGDLKLDLLMMLQHELGHLITYWHFRKAPSEIQQQLKYAWNKARLARRMGDPSRIQAAFAQATNEQVTYWSTFPEWLAEQYRRYATSDQRIINWLDQHFDRGAKRLESFYLRWEKQFGKESRLNISQPDYGFSAWMQYLRDAGDEKQSFTQLMRREVLYSKTDGFNDTPTKLQLIQTVEATIRAAIASMAHMVPTEVSEVFNERLDPHIVPGYVLEASPDVPMRWLPDMRLIEVAVGVLATEKDIYKAAQAYYGHEVFHSVEELGLISDKQIALLMRDIKGKEYQLFSKSHQTGLFNRVQKHGKAEGWTDAQIKAKYELMRDREFRAYYMQKFIEDGTAWSEEAKTIFAYIIAILERVANAMRGLGYQTREDVVRAFFKGEMVARADMRAQDAQRAAWSASHYALPQEVINQKVRHSIQPSHTWQIGPNLWGAVEYFGELNRPIEYVGRREAKAVLYHFYEAPTGIKLGPVPPHRNLGKLIGILELKGRGPAGFEVEWIQSDAFALAQTMLKESEKDLGIITKLPGKFTQEGMLMAQILTRVRGQKGITDLYVQHKVNGESVEYYSPNYIKEQQAYWRRSAQPLQDGHSAVTIQHFRKIFNDLMKRIPKNTWNDPRIDQMFALPRNHYRDEVQGATLRAGQEADEGRLHQAITGVYSPPDVFTSTAEVAQRFSQAANARETGMAFRDSAPRSMLSYEVRRTYEKLSGVGESAEARRELVSTLHEADRIGWFTKKFWGLHQLVWRNEHLSWLRDYLQNAEGMNNVAQTWLRTAEETAREWNKAKADQREALSRAMFDLSDMRYRSAAEVAAKVTRNPQGWTTDQYGTPGFLQGVTPGTGTELDLLFKAAGVKPQDQGTIRRIQNDFINFIRASANVEAGRLQRTLASSPHELATALAELQKQTATLLAKPFFPHMRFGEFTITVRDQHNKRKVVEVRAYDTLRQRDAAVKDVRALHPGLEIAVGRVPPHSTEFMGLPPYMLKAIKEQLLDKVGKTPAQIALIDEQTQWIERFEHLHTPDRTFRKTWAPAHSVPGYSTDAFRAYANFFQTGSRYMARLAFKDVMEDNIATGNLTVTSGEVGNTAKRQLIVQYMQEHFRYIMEGGRDSGKLRAIAAQWFLGWSPAAAAMNLTQVPMVLTPWLGGNFGYAQAYGALVQATNALKASAGFAKGSPAMLRAREEMINQGRIETGQAAEIAAFAEGLNLDKLGAGTTSTRFWQNFQHYGMIMFSRVEAFNRELTFKASWDLALKNPNASRLQEIERFYPLEIADLMGRVGLNLNEAIAFMFAKESIDRTQFQYARYTDPPFMRGEIRKNFLIFLKYTQSMTYALRFNKSMFHMMLLFAFVYGLSGIPFAEDANELLRLLAAKTWLGRITGTNVDLLQEARVLVRAVTRGTILDEKGPDLALHGISRYGFGLGLLPQHWGAPRFDASANGSMGKVIPGLAEMMHGIALGKDKDMMADAAQRAAGAGYGYIFSLLHYIQEPPGTMDSKKWEKLLPRAAQGWAKAHRFGFNSELQGAETNSAGAKMVQFDVRDPHDLAEVVGQAMGFSPTRVTERWEREREIHDALTVYKARRTMLYAQMNRALLDQSPEAVAEVAKAIAVYNEQVLKIGDAQMVIKTNQLISSLRQRNSKVQMMEQMGVINKGQIGIADRIGDLYPGVKIEKVK